MNIRICIHAAALVLGLMGLGLATPALATPRMSLTAGTPCLACHVNPNGGGGRTELGWQSMSNIGMFTYEEMGMGVSDSNALFEDMVVVGLDARLQGARLGNPTLDESGDTTETVVPDYTFFPMQLQPYLSIKPAAGLTLYGTFGAGPETLRGGKFCDTVFPGMSCYEAYALYESPDIWTVRGGVFQPSIGIRHDDHTLFIRGDARDRRRPIIAPNYAEPGAELIIQPASWFRSEIGGYVPVKLEDTLETTAELWPAAYNARITFLPYIKIPLGSSDDDGFGDDDFGDDFGDDDFGDEGFGNDYVINSWFGASAYGSGDFLMLNGFVGLGIHEGVSFVAEVSQSSRTLQYDTLNGWVGLWYTPWQWVSAALRVERAQTTTTNDEDVAWSYVGGLEFFPVPYVEIRPEYRLVQNDSFRFGQATVQFHVFY